MSEPTLFTVEEPGTIRVKYEGQPTHEHKRRYLSAILSTWLGGTGKPTREQQRRAERAAQAALDVLYGDEPTCP